MSDSRKPIRRWEGGAFQPPTEDELAVEEPLEILVESRPVSITMRTPGHDEELAAGFLISEGVLDSAKSIEAIRPFPRNEKGNAINVFLKNSETIDFARLTRHVFASSSCGICGRASIEAIQNRFPPLISKAELPASILLKLPRAMREHQTAFDRTGGLHAAALFNLNGKLLVLREDVGRHNAVDKVIGHGAFIHPFPLDECVLLVSGRASFEILQKALAARIPIIAAISAPSSLAVDFAEAGGQTLVGFLREDRFNLYTHPERITTPRE